MMLKEDRITPSETGEIELNLFKPIVETVSFENESHEIFVKSDDALTLEHFNGVLIYELQAHLKDLRDVHHIGVVEELEHLIDASRISVSCLLHKRLSRLAELILSSSNLVLISRLHQRYQDISVYLHIARVHKLQKTLEDLWGDVGNGNFSLIAFNKWPIKHFGEHF